MGSGLGAHESLTPNSHFRASCRSQPSASMRSVSLCRLSKEYAARPGGKVISSSFARSSSLREPRNPSTSSFSNSSPSPRVELATNFTRSPRSSSLADFHQRFNFVNLLDMTMTLTASAGGRRREGSPSKTALAVPVKEFRSTPSCSAISDQSTSSSMMELSRIYCVTRRSSSALNLRSCRPERIRRFASAATILNL